MTATAHVGSVRASLWVGLIGLVGAAVVTFPGLLETGLWTHLELEAFHRAQASLGEPVSIVLRSPVVPTWLEAQALAFSDTVEAIRIPHALATCVTVALAGAIAKLRGWSTAQALVVAGFAIGFPIVATGGRLAAGHAVGEALAGIAVFAGLIAARQFPARANHATRARTQVALWSTLCVAATVAACAAMGIVLGALLPVLAIALIVATARAKARTILFAGAGILAAVAGYLIYHQGNGYIPVLGAAKDLGVIDSPLQRDGVSGLTDFGFQIFPWLPLVVTGLLFPGRDRMPAQWLLLGLAICSGWSLIYGRVALPLTIPTAMVCAAGVCAVFRQRSPHARRLALVTAVGGLLIMAKDAARTPRKIGDPLGHRSAFFYPTQELRADHQLSGLSKFAAFGLIAFALFGHHDPDKPGDSRLARVREKLWWGPYAILAGLLAHQAVRTHGLVAQMGHHASPRKLLETHASWVARGQLPSALTTDVDDESLPLYVPAPEDLHKARGRFDLNRWLSQASPAVALVRRAELPHLVHQHRAGNWPLYVLDASNFHMALVSNVLPDGARDHNPLADIVLDEPPVLANNTLLRFEDALEVIGWQVEGPVIRGRPFTIVIALRALKNLPSHTEIYTRLQEGRLSRINYQPVPITGKQYPPNLWRNGDIIVHRQTLDAPTLEIVTAEHDLVIALRRNKTSNFRISFPEERETPDVTILDNGRHFASIGKVMVW